MRPTQFSADTVVALLRKQTVVSLTDVMAAFGPRVSRRTAFRKLKVRISEEVDRRFRPKWITCFGRSGSPISAEVDRFRPKWITRFRGS